MALLALQPSSPQCLSPSWSSFSRIFYHLAGANPSSHEAMARLQPERVTRPSQAQIHRRTIIHTHIHTYAQFKMTNQTVLKKNHNRSTRPEMKEEDTQEGATIIYCIYFSNNDDLTWLGSCWESPTKYFTPLWLVLFTKPLNGRPDDKEKENF